MSLELTPKNIVSNTNAPNAYDHRSFSVGISSLEDASDKSEGHCRVDCYVGDEVKHVAAFA